MSAGRIKGDVWRKGDEGYEAARRAAAWQLRKPDRYPDFIVRVAHEQDVVEAVRQARERGLRVKARGGGHSITASAIRDGMLIDVSGFREITIDPDARTATVTPSVHGSELSDALLEHGLFFPGGHCPGVGLGGYLLQGGFGWNGRSLGMACSSVSAIDVVTADGELIHADDTSNADYMWAARGAGSGFFGAVTRFHLDLHPMPQAMLLSVYAYPMDTLTEVLPWFLETVQPLPRAVEPFLFGARPPDAAEHVLVVFAVSYTDTEQQGRDALAAFETWPVLARAVERRFATPTTFSELYEFMSGAATPGRYCVDGMWTREPAARLVPAIEELFASIPTPQSTLIIMPWCDADVPNGAFSLQAPLYISPCGISNDERDDDRCFAWATEQMRRLEPLSVGIQLADENLINRPAPFMSPGNVERLERLRATHDRTGVFHSYLSSDPG